MVASVETVKGAVEECCRTVKSWVKVLRARERKTGNVLCPLDMTLYCTRCVLDDPQIARGMTKGLPAEFYKTLA